jgi:hypothetical protein
MREAPLDPNLKYAWQQVVLDALIEYPPVRYKIDSAERAISGRLCQKPTDPQEVRALGDALFALQIVFPEARPKVELAESKTNRLIGLTKPKHASRFNRCVEGQTH